MARECKNCSACCDALAVSELQKDVFTPCVHQCKSGGCSIYPTRPATCKAWTCGYLQGIGSDDERPDQTGVVLDPHPGSGFTRIMQMSEVTDGALSTPYALRVKNDELSRGSVVLFLSKDRKRAFFPPLLSRSLHRFITADLARHGFEFE